MAAALPDDGGKKHDISSLERMVGTGVLQFSTSLDAYDYTAFSVNTSDEGKFTADSPHTEMIAMDQLLPRQRLGLVNLWRNWTNDPLLEIDAGQRLLDLERPFLASLGIDMVPVIETKRDVAVFLNLKDHDIAQGMNRPSPNEDAITGARGKAA